MRVHMFQGEDGLYGFTPQDDGGNLPAEYSPWRPLKSVEMVAERTAPRMGVHEAEILAAIKRQGYCITDVGPAQADGAHSPGCSTSAQASELEPISTHESEAREEGHDLVNGG